MHRNRDRRSMVNPLNQIFGYQILAEDRSLPKLRFEGTRPVEIPKSFTCEALQLQIFSFENTNLQTHFSDTYGSWAYVWGIPVYPHMDQFTIPAWCAQIVSEKRYALLKVLLDNFVIIIDSPRQRCITFVSDILGVRPMFVGKANSRIV